MYKFNNLWVLYILIFIKPQILCVCFILGVGNNNSFEQPDESMSESDLENTEMDGIGCVRVINLKPDDVEINNRRNKLWALVLTPTRELAIQIKNHLTAALKYIDLKVSNFVSYNFTMYQYNRQYSNNIFYYILVLNFIFCI